MSQNRWPADTLQIFIGLFQVNRCLWDVKSHEYKLKQKKNDALNDMVDKFKPALPQINSEVLKKKINSLRSQFLSELKKRDNKRRTPMN